MVYSFDKIKMEDERQNLKEDDDEFLDALDLDD